MQIITTYAATCLRCKASTYATYENEFYEAGWTKIQYDKFARAGSTAPINHLCADCSTAFGAFLTGEDDLTPYRRPAETQEQP